MSNNKDILTLPTFLTYSLGCRTNQAEMEEISLQLTDYGLQQIGDSLQTTDYRLQQIDYSLQQKGPDLVLLNTCVVTTKAEKETRQKIRELRKKYPKSFLVVLGCAVTAKEKFNIILPEVDLLISNKEKESITKSILDHFCHFDRNGLPFKRSLQGGIPFPATGKGSLHSLQFGRDDVFKNKYIQSGRKFIKIQEGCDRFCSFCLTAHLRGKLKSVPPEKVIEEINFWVGKGIKEVVLTGINIGLYKIDRDSCHSDQAKRMEESLSPRKKERDPSTSLGMTITNLVNNILLETKIERISFSSIYPEMLTDDFIKLVVNNPRVSQYFHLSLQSGSPSVLERMNRETDVSRLLNRLKQIKAENQFFTFRADIITGFPNETEKEFQETLDFIKKAKISFVHHFLFSRRQHTKSEAMIKNKVWKEIPNKIKKQRAEMLNKIVEEIRDEEAKKMIDSLFHCLIVRKIDCHPGQLFMSFRANPSTSLRAGSVSRGIPFSRKAMERDPSTSPRTRRCMASVGMTKDPIETWEGLTENGWPVRARVRDRVRKGQIIPVKITGDKNDQLFGEIVVLPTNGCKTSGISTEPSVF